MEQNISLYQNLQEISALTFHQIKFTGNVFLLDKNYDEDKNYGSHDVVKIQSAWIKMYDEYFEKTDDTRFRKELRNKKKTLDLLLNINLIKSILSVLRSLKENEEFVPGEAMIKTVASLGNSLKEINKNIKFDSVLPLKKNIKNVESYLGGLQSRYEILFKEDVVVEEKDILLFYEIKSRIEQVLQKDHIPDYINMLQWIAYEKEVKKKQQWQATISTHKNKLRK